MIRLGKFYFGWGRPAPVVSFPPEMIVCRDERQAQDLRRQLWTRHEVRVVTPRLSQILGCAPAKITVVPGVDLDRDLDGEGSLRALLRQRQMTWGERAVLIEL